MSATDKHDQPWRSLEELADTEDFRRHLEQEFPSFARLVGDGMDRRTLLKVMGASLALGGLAACSEAEEIVPYVRQPENTVPGRPRFYATTLNSHGFGIGALVESHEGRPTKAEGNPDHPASRGASDAIMQAAPLILFDPDRSRVPLARGTPASNDAVVEMLADVRAKLESGRHALAILLEPTTSPTLKAQIGALKARHPALAVYTHDPLGGEGSAAATRRMTGRALMPRHHVERARVILSLDGDFLGEGPGRLTHARGFAANRRVRAPSDSMNRLYAAETTPTITGAAADHRRAVRPGEFDGLAAGLARRLGIAGMPVSADDPWLDAVARDLEAAGRDAMVIAGEHQSAFVHAAALNINARLGVLGRTVDLIEPPDAMEQDGDLVDLAAAARAGRIDTLLVLGTNPAYTAPRDLNIRDVFNDIPQTIHWGLYRDETAALAHWHIPAAHELESWSDLRAYDGTASIVQPLIRPLYDGLTTHRLLAVLAGDFELDAREIVRQHWADRLDEESWRRALRDGVIAGTTAQAEQVSINGLGGLEPRARQAAGLELRFAADPFLRDGRHANAAWLQELPRPLTKMVWGNAALFSPRAAARLGIENRQAVILKRQGYSLDAAAWIVPGHPDETVTLSFGFGRAEAGDVARLAGGSNAFRLRTRDAQWFAGDLEVVPVDERRRVLTTQHHHAMEGRRLVRHASLEEFRDDPDFTHDGVPPPPTDSVYGEWSYPRESWGMSIDQTACIGCMACVAACQAENNIPTVGPDECERGHEMHWLRVDRYYEGAPEDPETLFQPVPCMHCEKAPCEPVCPVNATVHTHDGLNAQVYNRCIGTRYCSQNCPYKVRRFNFLEYQPFDKHEAGPQQAMRNPDVSVRSRGVMEKCTYCVQRISAARIEAKLESREIEDGEVVTACQQACPTEAISFGDLNDPEAQVVADKGAPHDYALLAELNTRPRTTYLGRIRNPNPEIAGNGTGGERDDG